jgi:type II secretion system protein N
MALLSATSKRWLRWLGYPLFALLAFVYAVHLTFPYNRLQPVLEKAVGDGFDLDIEDIGPGWFPGDLVVKNASLTSHPKREGDKPITFTVDRLDVDLAVWQMLGSKGKEPGAEIRAQVGEGVINGGIDVDADGTVAVTLDSEGLPLGEVPGVASALGGVPMEGGLNVDLAINLPAKKHAEGASKHEYSWGDLSGAIDLSCTACTVGDGKTVAHSNAPGSSGMGGGLTLPKLRLGSLAGRLEIAKGVGRFVKFGGKSPDGEVMIDGRITFEDPFTRSQVLGYMRFKADPSLLARDARMADMLTVSRGSSLRPDGYMGVKIWGAINAWRFGGSKISPPELALDDKAVSTGPAIGGHHAPPSRPVREPAVGTPSPPPLARAPEPSEAPSGPPDAAPPPAVPDAAPPPPPPQPEPPQQQPEGAPPGEPPAPPPQID